MFQASASPAGEHNLHQCFSFSYVKKVYWPKPEIPPPPNRCVHIIFGVQWNLSIKATIGGGEILAFIEGWPCLRAYTFLGHSEVSLQDRHRTNSGHNNTLSCQPCHLSGQKLTVNEPWVKNCISQNVLSILNPYQQLCSSTLDHHTCPLFAGWVT